MVHCLNYTWEGCWFLQALLEEPSHYIALLAIMCLEYDSQLPFLILSYTVFTYNPLLCSILIVFLQKLNLVNGVLFTGGWMKSGLYYKTVGEIFKVIHCSEVF